MFYWVRSVRETRRGVSIEVDAMITSSPVPIIFDEVLEQFVTGQICQGLAVKTGLSAVDLKVVKVVREARKLKFEIVTIKQPVNPVEITD